MRYRFVVITGSNICKMFYPLLATFEHEGATAKLRLLQNIFFLRVFFYCELSFIASCRIMPSCRMPSLVSDVDFETIDSFHMV